MKRRRMLAPTVLAVVADYGELIAALRARRDLLRLNHETIDAVSGLQAGYTSKLMADPPMKSLGLVSLGPMLGALGLRLLVVHDGKALKRVQNRLIPRKYRKVRAPAGMTLITADNAREMAKRRNEKLSPKRRSELARKAATMRWRTPRLVEITDKVKSTASRA